MGKIVILGLLLVSGYAWGNDTVIIENEKFRLEFAANGQPKSLLRLSDGRELLYTADPGPGFYLQGVHFEHGARKQVPLDDLAIDGRTFTVSKGYSKFTFDLNLQPSYVAFDLVRVEGVPAQNLTTLHFQMNLVEDVGLHPLDHMTYRRNGIGSTDGRVYREEIEDIDKEEPYWTRTVDWNWLWDRNPDNPFGAFALQCPENDAEHDETLLDIWVSEDALPKPMIPDEWTVERAREWLSGWMEWSRDIRSITIDGKNTSELRELVDFAEREEINQIKLFTHTWRGGFWPYQRNHLIPNPEVFPGGADEFKEFCDYVAGKGMRLELHTLSMCIYNGDTNWVIRPEGPDPRLAHWVKGELAKPVSKDDIWLEFRPEPGSALPNHIAHFRAGPKDVPVYFKFNILSVGNEFFQVDEFVDTDKDVWKLKARHHRGMFGSERTDHDAGEKVVGYIRPYGQVFTADNNSTLLEDLARGYAEFSNYNNVTMMSLDGLEVHAQDGYGEPKFGRYLYQYLDHYCTSGSSTGGAMPFHMEYWFKAAQRNYKHSVSMPLALERTGRRATNPYEVHAEVAKHVANNAPVGGLMKPEPMFDLSVDMLNTHGLSDRFVAQLRLWRKTAECLADDQREIIADGYRAMTSEKLGPATKTGHTESDVLYEPRMDGDQLVLMPHSLLKRPGIDRGWGTGQEFGPICVWQFVSVNETVGVENRYPAQEPEFVIHVMPALSDRTRVEATAEAGEVDKDAQGYDIGAGLETALKVEGEANALLLQPEVGRITNRGDHVFTVEGDGLRMSYDNRRETPYTNRDDLPYWEVKANSDKARGIGMTVTGDGSGAVLLVQLQGHGKADYIVPLDFTGTREIVIPTGIASWTDQRWFWTMSVKNMKHERPIGLVKLAMGHVPPKTKATAVVSNLRLLAEVPASLMNPTLKIGDGTLQVQGEIPSDHYAWYTGGDTVGVYDLNWNEVKQLPVIKQEFIVPARGEDIAYEVLSEGEGPYPQLGVQIFTFGTPMTLERKPQ